MLSSYIWKFCRVTCNNKAQIIRMLIDNIQKKRPTGIQTDSLCILCLALSLFLVESLSISSLSSSLCICASQWLSGYNCGLTSRHVWSELFQRGVDIFSPWYTCVFPNACYFRIVFTSEANACWEKMVFHPDGRGFVGHSSAQQAL